MTVAELVGRRLVFGLPGPDLTDADVRLFRETEAGGVILYRRNLRSPEGVVRLVSDLEAALDRRLLVTTDHEGGRVVMLGEAVTIFPDGLAAGAAGDPDLVERQGRIEGRELRRLGVDLSFAPVLDVLGPGYSPNIGIRAYGTDPARVAVLGAARIRGLQASGVSACAKHFPGQGLAPVDAHVDLPMIDAGWAEMHATHLVPFRAAIGAGVDALMTSHPLYPRLDPAPRTPATFSRRLVTDFLRQEVGYQGLVVSDDLEMGAVRKLASVGEASARAAAAGHDLLLVCHSEDAQRAAYAALIEADRAGVLPRRESEASRARIDGLVGRRASRVEGGPPRGEPDGPALARELAGRAARVVAGTSRLPFADPGETVVAVFPRLSTLAARITVEAAMLDEAAYVRELCGGLALRVEVVGVEPEGPEIARAAAAVREANAALLFLYDAHLYPSNRALLDAVQDAARRLAVVLMRDPWDADWLHPGVVGVTAFGWRRCQLEAALACLAPITER
ncbi:MAG: beta-N-acetylhexosaminidase [Candidatus Rokuibacteriota bacterium]|nr:MAG: beta-N-acetylhexosaminidase [Candidatus Rokubacteria bacterium]